MVQKNLAEGVGNAISSAKGGQFKISHRPLEVSSTPPGVIKGRANELSVSHKHVKISIPERLQDGSAATPKGLHSQPGTLTRIGHVLQGGDRLSDHFIGAS